MTPRDLKQKLGVIPDWVAACESQTEDVILMHQDAFAPQLETNEILLLGCAIKYAGLCGKEVRIIAGSMEPKPSTSIQ
jgi:hypothetical protein